MFDLLEACVVSTLDCRLASFEQAERQFSGHPDSSCLPQPISPVSIFFTQAEAFDTKPLKSGTKFYGLVSIPKKQTQRDQAAELLQRRGIVRLSEFKNVGITAATIKRMVEAGDPAPEAVLEVFKEVLAQRQADGVLFDTVAVRVSRIHKRTSMAVYAYGRQLTLAAPVSRSMSMLASGMRSSQLPNG